MLKARKAVSNEAVVAALETKLSDNGIEIT
jgi:hypothetical protein